MSFRFQKSKLYDMKIAVTGATGFLGRHVLKELAKLDDEVVIAGRKTDGSLAGSNWKHVLLDLDNYVPDTNYFSRLDQPDLLIHLAWQGLPNYKSLFHFEHNLMMQYGFLKNMVMHGLKNVVVTGTCFEYGMKEGRLSEEMITDPQNPYGLAKDTLRKCMTELQKKCHFELKWIRLFYMYGEGQHPGSLVAQLQDALDTGAEEFNMSGGAQERDYLPAERVAEYIVTIALQNEVSGIINCCSGKPITVKQLIENYLKTHQRKIKLNLGYYPYPDYEAMSFWGDTTKLKKIIH